MGILGLVRHCTITGDHSPGKMDGAVRLIVSGTWIRKENEQMESCIHIYCGEGKGKSTAAIGLAVRAAGRRKKVLITRFLKTDQSGEVEALSFIPGVSVTPCLKSFGFYYQMTKEQKEEAAVYYEKLWEKTAKRAVEENFDLLVLDEIMAAMSFGFVKEEKVMEFLTSRPSGLEVVLTGRGPSKELAALADYVSEIQKVKHPFDKGIGAREGIEY